MDRILEHIQNRLSDIKVEEEPFPHFIANRFLPDDIYSAWTHHIPMDQELFCDDPYRFGLSITDENLTRFSPERELFWRETKKWLLSDEFRNAIAMKFYPNIKLRFLDAPLTTLESSASFARAKDKFVLGPHTDMAHRIITLVFYLAEDSEHWQAGTSQYIPRDVMFRCSGGPHYDFGDFKKVATAKFLPNTVFGFFKSDYSFHGVEPWNDLNFIRNSIQYEINDTNRARYYGKK